MSDIFVSYARSTERHAQRVTNALRALGYDVWRDDELPAHRPFGEVIAERLKSSKAVVVVWSEDALKSHWVLAEADVAREAGTLVQLSIDGVVPPMPFNQIQCVDLKDWSGDTNTPGWQKVESSIALLTAGADRPSKPATRPKPPRKFSICVLPFQNMSGDAEQEYFSDGISEDIITDLSKVSALSVIARNTAFTFKGQAVDVVSFANQLNVSHVLEGSVRKAGGRVRITAQLIDAVAGDHLWAERYDRDLNDIFALQDEISKAIVGALRLKLLPDEKRAIEQRGTTNPEAYNLYLMARQYWVSGNDGDRRRDELILRICRRATEIDPNYARAWSLMALVQTELRFRFGEAHDSGIGAAERALSLDPDQAEAHCVKARYLAEQGRHDEARGEIATALNLDPESWEVNKEAARLAFRRGDIEGAIPLFEKATNLMDTDYHDSGMLAVCYTSLNRLEAAQQWARITITRAERALSQDMSNGAALGHGAYAMACLGQAERAKEWIDRALLVDPDNLIVRYNLACALSTQLNDANGALDLLEPYFAAISLAQVNYTEVDPDMDKLRTYPRFLAMVADAKRRFR